MGQGTTVLSFPTGTMLPFIYLFIGILPCFLKEEHVRRVPQAILEGMIKEALSASNILLWKKGYEEYRRETESGVRLGS